MEYKADEWRMYQATQQANQLSDWPRVGMRSGVALRNPPMSAWIFIAAAKVFRIHDPVGLVRFVQLLNCAAMLGLAGLLAFAARTGSARELLQGWAWAIALAAVNPYSIVMERKIWSQSVLPFFSVFLLGFWWKREKAWAAFGLGFLGMMLGQIHMSGFFYLAVLAGGLLVFTPKTTRWGWLIAGGFMGALPLVPWLWFLLSDSPAAAGGAGLNPMTLKNLLQFRYWVLWASDAAGLDLRASLGSNLPEFLSYPRVGGVSTYLCGALYAGLALSWGMVIIQALRKAPSLLREFRRDTSKSNQLLWTGFAAYGVLMTFLPFAFARHYLLIAFPLTAYWLARLALRYAPRFADALLLATVAAHLILSVEFLVYIHENGGAPRGEYGTAYQKQTGLPSGDLTW